VQSLPRTIERQTEAIERNLILQFRPKIVARGGMLDDGKVWLKITNIGGSPARVVTCKIETVLLAEGRDMRGYLKGPNDIPAGTILSAGENKALTKQIDPDLLATISDIDKICREIPGSISTRQIYCAGKIEYADDLGITRTTGIYRRYKAGNGRFYPSDESDLEYAD
jgi:hypothetical protein